MSADNYMLIRKHKDRFVVTMEFASDDRVGRIDRKSARQFGSLREAEDFAFSEWTEYGVRFGPGVRESE